MTPQGWDFRPAAGSTGRAAALRALLLGVAFALAAGFFAFALTTYLTAAPPTRGATPTTPSTATPSTATPTPDEDGPDYDPPPLPNPANRDEAHAWLERNALYGPSLVPIGCAIERLADSGPPDLEVVDAHLDATMDCLMAVWVAPVQEAGFVLPRPPVLSYDQPITTACGTSPSMDRAAAFYCPADQRIFYAVDRSVPLFSGTSLTVDSTLAHELGHALQGRSGILLAEWALVQTVDEAAGLELSRRTELQADCLGGLALNALAAATGLTDLERDQLREDNYSRGDRPGYPRTHGAPESGLRWISQGLGSAEVGGCNTFVVAPEDVA